MKKLALIFGLVVLFAIAWAGAPPVEVIPWRPCVVVDTLGAKRIVVQDTVWYITKDDYMREVLGMEVDLNLRRTQRRLRIIEAYLRAHGYGDDKK